MACIAAKPIVDGLETEFAGKLVVVRLNVQDSDHQPLVDKYSVRATPTFVLLSANGEEIWRSFVPIDADKIRQLLNIP